MCAWAGGKSGHGGWGGWAEGLGGWGGGWGGGAGGTATALAWALLLPHVHALARPPWPPPLLHALRRHGPSEEVAPRLEHPPKPPPVKWGRVLRGGVMGGCFFLLHYWTGFGPRRAVRRARCGGGRQEGAGCGGGRQWGAGCGGGRQWGARRAPGAAGGARRAPGAAGGASGAPGGRRVRRGAPVGRQEGGGSIWTGKRCTRGFPVATLGPWAEHGGAGERTSHARS